MVVGGTDTSSNTVEFAMAEIMSKPSVVSKIQNELETVVSKDNIVEESHIPKLPYLHARQERVAEIAPGASPVGPPLPSVTCTVGCHTVPKGSRVFINVWAIHRDPSIWSHPLEFHPERFLRGKGDYSGNDFNYFPFGFGTRTYAGIDERMVLFSLTTLFQSFDWKLPEPEKMDLTEQFGIVLKKKTLLVAIPSSRLSDSRLYE